MKAWRPASCAVRRLEPVSRSRFFTSSSVSRRRAVIVDLLEYDSFNPDAAGETEQDVTVNGWVRSVRKQKRVAFAHIGDGTTTKPLQAVLKPEQAANLSYGTAVTLTGAWTPSQGGKQARELQVSGVEILGENHAESNPVQPKYQTPEFLRTVPHLRPRIPSNALLLRLRSQVISTLTQFFDDQDFVQTHTPIITSSDCEGAGEVFTISSNDSKVSDQKATPKGQPQVEHFFRNPKYLTVSAQLHLEALAQAVDRVWTLSPTFRAEKSDTPRHLSEFYMLEAEVCFASDMKQIMDLVEGMLQNVAGYLVVSRLGQELLETRASSTDQREAEDTITADVLQQRWHGMASQSWPRITYHEAVEKLQNAVASKEISFEFKPTIEDGLQAEHERWLASTVGKGAPVFITDYPTAQKPFYMPRSTATSNSRGSEQTVACFDLLVPDLCELAGGSMREHRSQELLQAMESKGVAGSNLEWYQDLRKYGSVPHGGFGLGFDRLLCYLSGVGSVRDVVAFPRWHGRCDC
ncbi:Class II Aminoacyl-tRNA synthetase/Biotinyl protein ligase (BPL) and lipoyl protein ligase (LPL) [Septoria linicola]|uniref:asparagine--tRNA ligase n=1 Tax=Septoria linicola TaxID=215465 RepID=A0A9Q9ESC2_9PEZI|nr:Class II Aminoacyl-tRNA synthetase/Biotinyl protein ligase (BPL) and lipoyl protein ligase (LPL) [Septoria linicola]